jgi:hypothetical protein
MEISGGDDAINENDTPAEPRPTRHDILKAVSTINRYNAGFNMNPIARGWKADGWRRFQTTKLAIADDR